MKLYSTFLFFRLSLLAAGLWIAAVGLGRGEPAMELYLYQRGYVQGGTGAPTALTDEAVSAFERRTPGVRVRVIGVPWEREGSLKLRTALLARRRIDVFRLAHDELPGFMPRRGELLAPIDPYLTAADRADIDPAALQGVTIGGRAMAWPLWSTAVVMLANPAVLERFQIQPPEGRPWQWDEFEKILRRVTAPGSDGHRLAGLNAASLPPLFEWAPLLMAQCGPLLTEQTPADGALPLAPGLGSALDAVGRWRSEGLLAADFGAADAQSVQDAFLQGRLAFLLTSPGFLRTLHAKGVPYRILPPPVGAWGKPITIGALGCYGVVRSADPVRQAAAMELGRWLTSAEIAQAVPGWYLAPPARRSVGSFYDRPGYGELRAILPTARYLRPPVSSGFMEGVFIPKLQGAVLGQLNPAQAIEEIQAAARRQSVVP